MLRVLHLLLFLILLLISLYSLAQTEVLNSNATRSVAARPNERNTDTVRPGKGLLETHLLKPGLRQYLVCFRDLKNDRQLGFWYWLRDIRQEKRNGREVIVIAQRWYGSDTNAYRVVVSINDAADFAPVYHRELARGKTSAYDWKPTGIVGADSVEGNSRKGWSLTFSEPNFNWNLDIETFELLPLEPGKSYLINFYDAGLDPPQYVRYTVKGSEMLTMLDGARTDCWKLYTEGKDPRGGSYSETYWISKKEHEMLKEEDQYGSISRFKIRMPAMTPDVR